MQCYIQFMTCYLMISVHITSSVYMILSSCSIYINEIVSSHN
ncbi:hypothetical protein F383_21088 [Gossypium arboreum]|uniref:Uncharacterized protein n=1 Tax=Gossypium arboreum TaxID=29729 RepID=A0A0B0NUP8_GOSAR|nr:hypothetical protein F383_21088 [Gossypium arboreum]